MTDVYPIRPAAIDEAAAFAAVGEQAFNSTWPAQAALQHELITFEADRSLAALDGAAIVGTAAAYTFRMAVPGGMTRVAGVSWVSVLPSHRRRGILSSLMRRQLADIRSGGEAVAALYASEAAIYGKYGYGVASEHLSFTIRRGEGRLLPPRHGQDAAGAGSGLRLRITDPVAGRPELTKIYDDALGSRPGMIARDGRWWDAALADPEFARAGSCPLRCLIAEDDAGPRGYALFSVKPRWGDDAVPAGVLGVGELLAADPAACAALWTDLLTRDLVGEVRIWGRPADDPLLHLLADRRRARPFLTDGLWIRLADLPAALVQRRYASEVDVVIDVTDDQISENCGRWRLRAGGPSDSAPADCERTSAAADVAVPVQALGAAYLGGSRLGALASAGQVTELRPGALAALSAAMFWDPAPWCPFKF